MFLVNLGVAMALKWLSVDVCMRTLILAVIYRSLLVFLVSVDGRCFGTLCMGLLYGTNVVTCRLVVRWIMFRRETFV